MFIAPELLGAEPTEPLPRHVPALYAGGWVALWSLVAATWTSWQTARVQHTIAALQGLRTDREYLGAAKIVKRHLPQIGRPIPEPVLNVLKSPPRKAFGSTDFLTFPESVDFILNQYEFIALGARSGVMDEKFLAGTIRGLVCGLVVTLAPFIRHVRSDSPRVWENLIWLYLRFAADRPRDWPDLGPAIRR